MLLFFFAKPASRVCASEPRRRPSASVAIADSMPSGEKACQCCGAISKAAPLRCSRWRAAQPTLRLSAPSSALCHTLRPASCPGSKLVYYCSKECQLAGQRSGPRSDPVIRLSGSRCSPKRANAAAPELLPPRPLRRLEGGPQAQLQRASRQPVPKAKDVACCPETARVEAV